MNVDPLISELSTSRLIPVVVLDNPADASRLGVALLAGGVGSAEITFRTDAAAAAISSLTAQTDLLVGAGTVLRPEQVDAAVAAGARFVVSPGLSAAVVARARELSVPIVPGVATATEIMAALDLGIDVVKFFPSEPLGGVATLRALAGPFPTVRFIPTGGIDASLLPRYLTEPHVLAVGASWMVERALIAAGDWDEITARTATAMKVIRGERA
jgi:2-dehydro-3-deoxyphosphogluconate aldolase / (4S)-4-hydroxy-2-oxoglutarate aldolase